MCTARSDREDLTGKPIKGYVEPGGESLFVEKGGDGVPRSTVVQIHIGQKEESNEAEWEIVGAAYGLAPTAVVKRGARGLLVLGDERVELPAREGEVVDATGAGDALAAGFLVGGPELALEAAARCVAKLGAMP